MYQNIYRIITKVLSTLPIKILSTLHLQVLSPLLLSTPLERSGSRLKSERKKSSKIFPHCLKPFPKYFIQKKNIQKISIKQFLKDQIIEDQVLDLLKAKCIHSQTSVHSGSSKIFLEANPDLLGVSCTRIQAPARSTKSNSHSSNPTQFKYFEFFCLTWRWNFLGALWAKPPQSL